MIAGLMKKTGVFVSLLMISTQIVALELDARSEFGQRWELNSAVSGVVKQLSVNVGQTVKPGDILLALDDTPYLAAVNRAKAKIKSLEPAQIQMQSELEKAQELFDRDSLSLIDLQQAENNLQLAQGQLDAAQADLSGVEYALAQTVIRAPARAMVLAIHTHLKRYVNTAVSDQALVTLVDNQQMLATALLSAENWRPALLGKSATVSYRGKRYQGKVIRLGSELSSQGNASPGFELSVLFVASGEIPANMPLTINIQE